MSDELEAAKRDLSALRIHRDPEPGRSGAAKWAVLLVAGLAALVGGVLGFRAWSNKSASATVETATARVDSGAAGALFSAKGTILPDQKAEVSSRVMGKIKAIHVDERARVKRGDVLAELENDEVRAQVKEAEANVDRARIELARQEKLWKDRANMEKDVDDARTALKVADARLEYAKAQFENTFIRAPFDGMVVKKHVRVGEPVGPIGSSAGGGIVTLVDFDSLEMVAEVNETSLHRLSKVKSVEIAVDAVPNRKYHGAIRQMPTSADKAKGIVEVKIAIHDRDEKLLPNMSGRATFLEETTGAPARRVTVPEDAVVTEEGKSFVWVVRDGAARRVEVSVGASESGQVAVTRGLGGGEEVVLRPVGLKDGQRVKRKE